MDQNNPWNLQWEYNQRKLINKAQIFFHTGPIFPLLAKATASWHPLTHNTPKHFQTCYKLKKSTISYKTVDN